MRIKVYRAATIALAMAEIRDALGLDALILSTATLDGGVEVTAALETEDEPGLLSPLHGVMPVDPRWDEAIGMRPVPDRPWARHNLPADLAAALGHEPVEAACARLFRFGRIPISSGDAPTMLVGPPGVGKTLTIAKLAARLVLDGHTPMVITADEQRAGAVEQLAGFTRLLGLTLIAAGRPETLGRALARRAAKAPVLIDAPGLDLQDPGQHRLMTDLLSVSGAKPVLVLAAGGDPCEAAEIAMDHASTGARHLLATRLDRNGRLGGILAAARAADLILTEAGTSPSVADGLEPLSAGCLSLRLCRDRGNVTPVRPQRDVAFDDGGDAPRADPLAIHIAAQAGAARASSRPTFWKTLP